MELTDQERQAAQQISRNTGQPVQVVDVKSEPVFNAELTGRDREAEAAEWEEMHAAEWEAARVAERAADPFDWHRHPDDPPAAESGALDGREEAAREDPPSYMFGPSEREPGE